MILREAEKLRIGDRVIYRGDDRSRGTKDEAPHVGTISGQPRPGEFEIRTDDGRWIVRMYEEIEAVK